MQYKTTPSVYGGTYVRYKKGSGKYGDCGVLIACPLSNIIFFPCRLVNNHLSRWRHLSDKRPCGSLQTVQVKGHVKSVIAVSFHKPRYGIFPWFGAERSAHMGVVGSVRPRRPVYGFLLKEVQLALQLAVEPLKLTICLVVVYVCRDVVYVH